MKFVARLIGGKGASTSWGVFSGEGGHALRSFRTKKQAIKHAQKMNSAAVKNNQRHRLKPHPRSQIPENLKKLKAVMSVLEALGEDTSIAGSSLLHALFFFARCEERNWAYGIFNKKEQSTCELWAAFTWIFAAEAGEEIPEEQRNKVLYCLDYHTNRVLTNIDEQEKTLRSRPPYRYNSNPREGVQEVSR
tara:strand:- start:1037 stop:1609 length:573 start_codon:yes stop_codon:yes gene_type:complete